MKTRAIAAWRIGFWSYYERPMVSAIVVLQKVVVVRGGKEIGLRVFLAWHFR